MKYLSDPLDQLLYSAAFEHLSKEEILLIAKTELDYINPESNKVYQRLFIKTAKNSEDFINEFLEVVKTAAPKYLLIKNQYEENTNLMHKRFCVYNSLCNELLTQRIKQLIPNNLSQYNSGGILMDEFDLWIGPGPAIPNMFIGPSNDHFDWFK